MVLRLLWQEWADANAVPLSAIPVDGLFDDEAEQALPAGVKPKACSKAHARNSPSASSSSVVAPAPTPGEVRQPRAKSAPKAHAQAAGGGSRKQR